MNIFRRHQPARRVPHPDARMEAELQRIISLRNAIARKEEALADLADTIEALRQGARHNAGTHQTRDRFRQISRYRDETKALESAVTALHDEIAKRILCIDDTDLAYLDHHDRRR